MKRRDLEKKLKNAGYTLKSNSKHRIFAKDGCRPVQVPHSNEVNEYTAMAILKAAGIK